jgi:hypothetical protein
LRIFAAFESQVSAPLINFLHSDRMELWAVNGAAIKCKPAVRKNKIAPTNGMLS